MGVGENISPESGTLRESGELGKDADQVNEHGEGELRITKNDTENKLELEHQVER